MFKKIGSVDILNIFEYKVLENHFYKNATINHKANVNLLNSDIFKKVSKMYNISSEPKNYVYAIARGVTTLVRGARAQETTNANGDAFPREELLRKRSDDLYVYQTFNLKPLHTEHKADDPKKASGFLLDSHYSQYNPNDEHIDIVVCCDKNKDPEGAMGLSSGRIKSFSMGCNVDYTVCSICGNKAAKKADYCNHIRFMKCSYVNGNYCFEECYGVEYSEFSKVRHPADRTALTEQILSKAASKNNVTLLDELGFDKEAKRDIMGFIRNNMDNMPDSVSQLFEKLIVNN